MSIEVMALVLNRTVGSATRKAVLLAMADAANSDGSGIWRSAETIAAQAEVSRRTVFTVWQEMESEGLIARVGTRSVRGGDVIIWEIQMDRVRELPKNGSAKPSAAASPSATDDTDPVQLTARPSAAASPKPSLNHPIKPSNKADRFEEAWSLYTSCPLKANQTKKLAKQQWSKAVARAGSEDRIINSIRIEVRKRTGTKDFIANLPDMHRWLSQDRWQDVEPAKPDLLTPAPSGNSELLDKLFKAFAQTGQWYGNKHKLPFDPHHPEADYPNALYQKHGISKQKQGAGDV